MKDWKCNTKESEENSKKSLGKKNNWTKDNILEVKWFNTSCVTQWETIDKMIS